MGLAQIVLDPPPLQRASVKKVPKNYPGKPLHPPFPYWQWPYMETTHFKKGLPLIAIDALKEGVGGLPESTRFGLGVYFLT